MKKHIKITGLGIYNPVNQVENDYYLEHFKKQGRDITNLLSVLGREKRHIIDNNHENSLTMGIEAAKKALDNAGIKGEDVDMIIFASQCPEYTLPTNAAFLHNAIGANNHTIIFDTNAACAGMTIAVETASRYMLSNKRVNRALVVGSDANSLISNPEQEITYASFADGAAAIILEKTEEETGFIDAVHYLDSTKRENILYPPKGFSKSNGEKEYIDFKPFDGTPSIMKACEMIEEFLAENGLTIDSVDALCLSQFAVSNIEIMQKHFEIAAEKTLYAGDEVGYTSTSSPFFALNKGIVNGQIKRGDTVLFWTVGAGDEMIAMLFKY